MKRTKARARAGGVNTVVVERDGRLRGFSTDGPGFARAVREQFGVELRDVRVLVLGAGGGAGRAVAMQCATSGAQRLTLVNRSVEKLQPLHDAHRGDLSARLAAPSARGKTPRSLQRSRIPISSSIAPRSA